MLCTWCAQFVSTVVLIVSVMGVFVEGVWNIRVSRNRFWKLLCGDDALRNHPLGVRMTSIISPPHCSGRKRQSLFWPHRVMLRAVISSLLFVAAVGSRSWGPWVTPTKGEPWPKPQEIVNYEGYVIVRLTLFTFKVWNGTYNWMNRWNKEVWLVGNVTRIGRWENHRFLLWDVKHWYYVK
jgi:hypothetical protein